MSAPFGLLWRLRRHMPSSQMARAQHDDLRHWPCAVDVRCRNATGGVIAASLTDGYPLVQVDWANFAAGLLPPITLAPADVEYPALGAIVDELTNVAIGAECWVRVFGQHDKVAMDGTTAVSINDFLTNDSATPGAVKKYASGKQWIGQALEAYAVAVVAAKSVFLLNPMRLPIG